MPPALNRPKPSDVEFWYAALAADIGIIIRTNKRDSLITMLNMARRAACDPEIDGISITRSPDDKNEIWLVKRMPNLGPTQE